jgi:hypothetical protein
LQAKLDALEQAFVARVKPHHRLLIRASLDHIRFLEHTILRGNESHVGIPCDG